MSDQFIELQPVRFCVGPELEKRIKYLLTTPIASNIISQFHPCTLIGIFDASIEDTLREKAEAMSWKVKPTYYINVSRELIEPLDNAYGVEIPLSTLNSERAFNREVLSRIWRYVGPVTNN